MNTTSDKINNIHKLNKIFPYIIKIIVLIFIATVGVIFSQDFFGALLNTLTFLLTVALDLDSFRRKANNYCDLSPIFIIFQVIVEIVAIAACFASFIAVAWFSKGNYTVPNYHGWLITVLILFGVLSTVPEFFMALIEKE